MPGSFSFALASPDGIGEPADFLVDPVVSAQDVSHSFPPVPGTSAEMPK